MTPANARHLPDRVRHMRHLPPKYQNIPYISLYRSFYVNTPDMTHMTHFAVRGITALVGEMNG